MLTKPSPHQADPIPHVDRLASIRWRRLVSHLTPDPVLVASSGLASGADLADGGLYSAAAGEHLGSGQVQHPQDHDAAVGIADDVEDESGSRVELGAPSVGTGVEAGVAFRLGRERTEPFRQSIGDIWVEDRNCSWAKSTQTIR